MEAILQYADSSDSSGGPEDPSAQQADQTRAKNGPEDAPRAQKRRSTVLAAALTMFTQASSC